MTAQNRNLILVRLKCVEKKKPSNTRCFLKFLWLMIRLSNLEWNVKKNIGYQTVKEGVKSKTLFGKIE